MSTINQIQANRENAQRSTGPTTAAGKQASSRNSMRHGLTVSSIDNFPAETREEYLEFYNKLHADMAPGSALEQLYFEHFVFSHFICLRAQALEVQAMQASLANPANEFAAQRWRATARYIRTHANRAQKALNTFRQFQADRYAAIEVQDEITHELNSDISVPVSAPLARMLDHKSRKRTKNETALCVVYAESKRLRNSSFHNEQNEPNLNDEFDIHD